MNEYEQYGSRTCYPSEGRIEEFQISTDRPTPQQNAKDLAEVVEDNEEVYWALETE